eukprot:TRINITY_DN109505_c0_g1_i1.p1 TRINITY_DN109505_c0_g1~~TRINITY_DN109505_c0_g1_i1.p1  ORF type:complete len:917 (-),score=214.60 TRINITY_DN109505_c0_g1_i1:173-2818(-)
MCGPTTLRSSLVSGQAGADMELDECELIGQGAYGMVHKVHEKETGQSKVMKSVVRPEGWDDERLKMEAQILQNLDHPHILRIFSWYEEHDCINIVMEHCDGGELLKVIRDGRRAGEALPERWASVAIRQSFQALVYIHSKGVVHKDLKGQNLLLLHETYEDGKVFGRKPHVVICDLGIAEICCRGIFGLRGSKVAGTPATMAPEVWSGSCGPKSDVWSMGCVMFEMFTNKLPFEVRGSVEKAAKQQAKWVQLHSKGPDWEMLRCSDPAMNLCKQLLTFRESARPAAQQCLEHAWLQPDEEALTAQEVEDFCNSVMSWRDRSPCQRAFCLKVAANCTCIDKFAKIFTKFDTDHSGVLDTPEVVTALIDMGISKDMAKKTAKALDVNGDNSCEYLEFTAACLLSLEEQFDDLLRQEFRLLDIRRKGSLTDEEMEPLIAELKTLAASRGLELEELDADGDGTIDFQEFCTYFGRPNVSYHRSMNKGAVKGVEPTGSRMPMKQHVRIMGGFGKSVEMSMEHIRASFEQSMASTEKGKNTPKKAPGKAVEKIASDKAEKASSPSKEKPTKESKSIKETKDPKESKDAGKEAVEKKKAKKPVSASKVAASKLSAKPKAAPPGTAPAGTAAGTRTVGPAAKGSAQGNGPVRRISGGTASGPSRCSSVGSDISSKGSSKSSKGTSKVSATSSRSRGPGSVGNRGSAAGSSIKSRITTQDSDEDTVPVEEDSENEVPVFKPIGATTTTGTTGTAGMGSSGTPDRGTGIRESHISIRSIDAVRDSGEHQGYPSLEAKESGVSSEKKLKVPSTEVQGIQRSHEGDTVYMSLSAASLLSHEASPGACVGCLSPGLTLACAPGFSVSSVKSPKRSKEPTSPTTMLEGDSWIVSL